MHRKLFSLTAMCSVMQNMTCCWLACMAWLSAVCVCGDTVYALLLFRFALQRKTNDALAPQKNENKIHIKLKNALNLIHMRHTYSRITG